MRAIDTNVLVRLFALDEPRQVAAAESFIEDGAWASVLAVAETAWVLTNVYGLNAARLANSMEVLLKHRSIVVQDADTVAAALALFRERPGLGFSDCLMIELARNAGHLPFGTFDRTLSKVEGAQRL
jgi:predicted nucleic-acid-binding protein